MLLNMFRVGQLLVVNSVKSTYEKSFFVERKPHKRQNECRAVNSNNNKTIVTV